MTTTEPTHLSHDRPFAGLRPFDVADCEFFFGREKQVAALYRLLDLSHFVSVVGSSGSGKSSLVRAGLLPLLRKERGQKGGRPWQFATMHPSDDPLPELAAALVRLADEIGPMDDHAIRAERIELALSSSSFGLREALKEIPALREASIVLLVDQFEELFTYGAADRLSKDAGSRERGLQFVQLLLEAARSLGQPSIQVLITMRSDFIGDCAWFRGLPEAVSSAQFLVPSLSTDQYEDVIRLPIAKADGSIESELVQRLLSKTEDEPDPLPLLQQCLSRLWEASPSRNLTMQLYEQVGSLDGALSNHADQVMEGLPEESVEAVFRALSGRDGEGRETRRAIPLGQLCAETGLPREAVVAVVDRFRADDCSFLLPAKNERAVLDDADQINIVHEVLLRRWKKMSDPITGWLAAEADDGKRYRALLTISEVS